MDISFGITQITSLMIVYSSVYSGADQTKHQNSASLGFVWGIHRDRWIPRTNGQLRGKCFHLITSSWIVSVPVYITWIHKNCKNITITKRRTTHRCAYFMGCTLYRANTLRWRHNGRDCFSNHQPHDCLLNRLFRHRSKKISKLRVTGLCAGNSPRTGEFPAQRASYAENVSLWWRHHELDCDVRTAIIFAHEAQVLRGLIIGVWNIDCLSILKFVGNI